MLVLHGLTALFLGGIRCVKVDTSWTVIVYNPSILKSKARVAFVTPQLKFAIRINLENKLKDYS